MLLLVGLGNPGPGYARHRHNIGFMAVDEIVRRHGFTPWRPRFDGEVAEGQIEGVRVLALKPMTYMNNSGHAVAAAARFYKVPEAQTVVIHDEIELASGKLRVKQGGGNAGHNGLKSIDAQFGREYWRVRLGVGRPDRAVTDADPEAVANYVLHDFPKADRPWVEKLVDAVAEHFPLLAAGDHTRFQNRVTLALKPPPVKKEPRPATDNTSH
jgi:PTH1 family peptidyl-tRNA hydrolase